MTNVILIHGLGGNPNENWFPWLKEQVEILGANVIAPAFPNSNHPRLEEWLGFFKEYQKLLNYDTILVGHSLGCAFILNLLEKLDRPVRAVFLVAGFDNLLKSVEINNLIRSFVGHGFRWEHIKRNSGMFYIFHSDNDPYIPLDVAIQMAYNLGVEITLVRNAGHFNMRSNYVKFPKLLDAIKKEL